MTRCGLRRLWLFRQIWQKKFLRRLSSQMHQARDIKQNVIKHSILTSRLFLGLFIVFWVSCQLQRIHNLQGLVTIFDWQHPHDSAPFSTFGVWFVVETLEMRLRDRLRDCCSSFTSWRWGTWSARTDHLIILKSSFEHKIIININQIKLREKW